ncbi:MAG: polyhydroxyalkanoate depolymerase [Betaproteobacteria bacterium]|nr:polyhydroxyalkanoate depolymerase [Betaproteobacteria bacterium]
MIYSAYQSAADAMLPLRAAAGAVVAALRHPLHAMWLPGPLQSVAAACEMLARAGLTHHRPAFGLDTTVVHGRDVAVTEESAFSTAFGTLLHFRKDTSAEQPRVLVVAPLSGHFATLLRGTVHGLLPDHDVYLTDWHNARDVALEHGRFGLDEYTEHLVQFLEFLGPGAHVVAVCQPCVATLAAAAIMAEANHVAQPRSMTLMAGPIDARVNPTRVNELATSRPIDWFERNLVATVPNRFAGRGRRVYPGFVQLFAFMAMNPDRHLHAHGELFLELARGEVEAAETRKKFYDEYFAVLDLAAEFYLETVRTIFQEFALARGRLTFRGRPVDPRAIRRTALLTVEGEKDDICSIGQTLAAQDLCSSLKPYMKRHHMQAGVGHYGVFSGRRWEQQICPIVRNTILAAS